MRENRLIQSRTRSFPETNRVTRISHFIPLLRCIDFGIDFSYVLLSQSTQSDFGQWTHRCRYELTRLSLFSQTNQPARMYCVVFQRSRLLSELLPEQYAPCSLNVGDYCEPSEVFPFLRCFPVH
jgi:hypothetical protein